MEQNTSASDDASGASKPKRAAVLLLGSLLLLATAFGAMALVDETTTTWTIDGGTIDADDGPAVSINTTIESDRRHPILTNGSINLQPEILISGQDGTSLRYDGTRDGFVRASDMSLSGDTTLAHETEGSVTLSGSATGFEWRTVDPSTDATDLRYRGGAVTVDIASDQDIRVLDAETDELITTATEVNGRVTFDLPSTDSEWRSITLFSSLGPPEIDVDSASPTGPQSSMPDQVAVNVSDPDGTTMDVVFEHNGQEVGTTQVSGSGRASVSTGQTVTGDNQWSVEVTDGFGNTDTESFEFSAPGELQIYNESDPDQLVDGSVDVTVSFFGSDDEVISRTTTDGTIDMSGLPPDQEFTIQLEADGYVTRQTIIRSIQAQQSVFMLPNSVEAVSTEFLIEDPTGQIQQDNARIIIQKPIERQGETKWVTVVGDEMGPGGFSTLLEQDQRYKVQIEDLQTGEIREMGPYIATEPQTVILNVNQIEYQFGDAEGDYSWTADWVNETAPAVDFAFDAEHGLEQIHLTVTERGGNDVVIFDDTISSGNPIQERIPIPDSVANPETSTYIVEWEATIIDDDGNEVTVSGQTVVGPRGEIEPEGLPDQWMAMIGTFVILIVAGLFSYVNVGVGGVVTSLVAGVLWFVGMVPGSVTGLSIIFALLISILWMVRSARGPL